MMNVSGLTRRIHKNNIDAWPVDVGRKGWRKMGKPGSAGDDQLDLSKAGIGTHEAKAFLDTLIEMSLFAMWVSDAEGTMIRANRALREMLNVTSEELIGKYNVLQDSNLDAQGVRSHVQDVFDKHTPVRFTMQWTVKDVKHTDFANGRDLYVDVSLFPILNEGGRLRNVVCQWVDISERKAAEEKLALHRDRLEEEVRERTQELRALVNAMAGRENRMAELKEENQRLRVKLAEVEMSSASKTKTPENEG